MIHDRWGEKSKTDQDLEGVMYESTKLQMYRDTARNRVMMSPDWRASG